MARPRIRRHPVHGSLANAEQQLLGERGREARRMLHQEGTAAELLILSHHVEVDRRHDVSAVLRPPGQPGIGARELGHPEETNAAGEPAELAGAAERCQRAGGLQRCRGARRVVVRRRLGMAEMREDEHFVRAVAGQPRRHQRNRRIEGARANLDLERQRLAREQARSKRGARARGDHEAPAATRILAPPERGVRQRVGVVEMVADRRHQPAAVAQESRGPSLHHRQAEHAMDVPRSDHHAAPHLQPTVMRVFGPVLQDHQWIAPLRRIAPEDQR